MAVPSGSDYFELADYVGVLRRRWPTILVFTLIGIVAAAAYYYVTPRTYSATVLIQVNPLPTNANALGGRTAGPVNMDNEGQIVASATVGAIAKSQLGISTSVTDLLKEIKVVVPPNTTFLQVSCRASSADLAERCANAFGQAYLYDRRTETLNLITAGIAALNTQVTGLDNAIEQLRHKLAKGGLPAGSSARGVAELQLSAKLSRLQTIQSKIGSVTPLQASLSSNSSIVGRIATPAVVPLTPVSPKKKLILPSGLAAGLVLGLVFAYLWDWRRPRVYTSRDVLRRVNLRAVFTVTEARGTGQNALAPPRSRTGQVFTELAQYAGATLGDGHHVLIVFGASAGGNTGTVAANLAAALARTRGETVLICADPHGAAIPRLLGPPDGRGFAELLAGSATAAAVVHRAADAPRLGVITPGLDAAGSVYDMRHDRVQRLMRELRSQVRYVVIEVPPPALDVDTFSVAEFADGAILTIHSGATRPAEVTDCVQRLERMRSTVLAAVLVPAGPVDRSAHESVQPEFVPEESSASSARHSQRRSSQAAQPQPRLRHPYQTQPQQSQPHQTQPHQHGADEPNGSSAPVLRPVASQRNSSGSGATGSPGSSGGSRHAAAEPGLPGQWTPRNVSETWPLPESGMPDQDEEADLPDPLIGN
jgi:Mrp family chromosome partitioning ATPase/capsular polysaccharide biosynthesis protein